MGNSAFVTGITGQDGSYLTAHLLANGYKVAGGYRRSSSQTFHRLKALGIFDHPNLTLIEHDVNDLASNIRAISTVEPDEVYNLAAQSFVAVSFKEPVNTSVTSGLGALQMLEAARIVNPSIRFYQASSAEMFGKVQSIPQDEATPFHPRSPYGIAKLFAHWSAVNYRESYGMHVSCGILFNHESPLRGPEFVTRKISIAAAHIATGRQDELLLGNLDAQRDWGFAGEFVRGMHSMLQADLPDTFVLATGKTYTVRDFATSAFAAAGIALEWTGAGEEETGREAKSGRVLIRIDPKLKRPAEVDLLIGNPQKARERLGWEARVDCAGLAGMMVESDLRLAHAGSAAYKD